MNEFDEALEKLVSDIFNEGYDAAIDDGTLATPSKGDYSTVHVTHVKAIKQAVEKHIIGEDVDTESLDNRDLYLIFRTMNDTKDTMRKALGVQQ